MLKPRTNHTYCDYRLILFCNLNSITINKKAISFLIFLKFDVISKIGIDVKEQFILTVESEQGKIL